MSVWSFASPREFWDKDVEFTSYSEFILQLIVKRDLYLAVTMIKELLQIRTFKESFNSAVENILVI